MHPLLRIYGQAQLRLACYLLYDEINPVVYPPVIQKVPKVKKVKKIELNV
jgi:hypothetical protein